MCYAENRLPPSAVDVHKSFIVACIASTNDKGATKYLSKRFSTFAAIGILSEIEVNMSVFPSSEHLSSCASLTPQNNESAKKKKTTRISRAGAYIKPLLVQCALCASRKKSNQEIRKRYLNLKNRRGRKRAFITVAKMLLIAIYNILKKNKSYMQNFTGNLVIHLLNTIYNPFFWLLLGSLVFCALLLDFSLDLCFNLSPNRNFKLLSDDD